jgi:hypothetical protein
MLLGNLVLVPLAAVIASMVERAEARAEAAGSLRAVRG